MQYRKLGFTGLELSTVGLGTWAIGGAGWKFSWGPQDDQDSIRTIHRAIDLGMNWIDTAAAYGLGHSEEVVGWAVQGMHPRPILATKCGRKGDSQKGLYGDLSRASILAEAEASLRRLNVEVIDLYQIHWPDPEAQIEEGWGAVADLIRQGKVCFGGVSNFSVEQLKRIQPIHPVASLQPPYSMLNRGVETDLLNYCREHEIGVIAYSPMQKGLLTGAVTRERIARLPEDDHRKRDRMFQEPELGANLRLVDALSEIAGRKGITVAQLAIAWVLRRPEVTAAIVGGRKPEQVDETVKAADLALSESEIGEIEGLLQERRAALA